MTQIVNLVLDAFVQFYKEQLQDSLPVDDPLRPDIIKKGLLQQEKLESNIQLGVQGGDHDNPEDMDAIVTLDKLPDIGIYVPAREIGGGQIWMRRGVVRVECFYINEQLTEDEAHEQAYNVLGHVMRLVEDAPINGLVDDFSERAIRAFCYANTYFESGGPPTSFIFRGKVFFAFLTERL